MTELGMLLEVGLEGFYGQSPPHRTNVNPNFNIGTDFIANNRVPAIDFATVHSYPDQCADGLELKNQSQGVAPNEGGQVFFISPGCSRMFESVVYYSKHCMPMPSRYRIGAATGGGIIAGYEGLVLLEEHNRHASPVVMALSAAIHHPQDVTLEMLQETDLKMALYCKHEAISPFCN